MNIILYSACIPQPFLACCCILSIVTSVSSFSSVCFPLAASRFTALTIVQLYGLRSPTSISPSSYTREVSLLVMISSKTALRVSIISGGVKSKDIDKEFKFSFTGIRVENCGLTPITALPAPPLTTKLPWPGPFPRPPPLEVLPVSPPMNRL